MCAVTWKSTSLQMQSNISEKVHTHLLNKETENRATAFLMPAQTLILARQVVFRKPTWCQ